MTVHMYFARLLNHCNYGSRVFQLYILRPHFVKLTVLFDKLFDIKMDFYA